jgi:hypothetical protein
VDHGAGLGEVGADQVDGLAQPIEEAAPAQDAVDGGSRQPDLGGDAVGAMAGRLSQACDVALLGLGQPVRTGVGSRAAVVQAGVSVGLPARQPAVVETSG